MIENIKMLFYQKEVNYALIPFKDNSFKQRLKNKNATKCLESKIQIKEHEIKNIHPLWSKDS